MKRLFKVLLTLLALSLLLSPLCVFATEEESGLYVSADLKTIRVDGVKYYRCVGMPDNVYAHYEYEEQVFFEGDASDIAKYKVYFEDNPSYFNVYFCEATYTYTDGAVLTSYYVRHDYAETYKNVSQGIGVKYYVNYQWPEGNRVYFDKSCLADTLTQFYSYQSSDYFNVYARSDDDVEIECLQGEMYIVNDEYYFMPKELNSGDKFVSSGSLMGYLVTDEAVTEELKAGVEAYYNDDFGVFYDGNFAEGFSVFMIVLFFDQLLLRIQEGSDLSDGRKYARRQGRCG